MASQFAIITSVKRTLLLSKILPMHLVESKKTGYKPADFTANHRITPYTASVRFTPIKFFVNLSIEPSTCFLRTHAWVHFAWLCGSNLVWLGCMAWVSVG